MKFDEYLRSSLKEFEGVLKFAAVLVLLFILYLVGSSVYKGIASRGRLIAHIGYGEQIAESIDLSKVTEPYEMDCNGGGGYNKLRIEPGRIAVIEADCPDQICVNQGYITAGDLPIVCLPHEFVITVEGMVRDIDAISGR